MHGSIRSMLRPAGWLVIGTLLAAAGYEFALALGAASVGPEPGGGVAGSGVVSFVALLAMVAAFGLAIAFRAHPWRGAALLAPSAATPSGMWVVDGSHSSRRSQWRRVG